MTLRGKVAAMKKLNCRDLVVNAGISAVAPLEVGLYAIVLVEKQLWLAEGTCMRVDIKDLSSYLCVLLKSSPYT